MNKPKLAVIGAGITGLSAAWLLRNAYDVTLYESAPRAGGHADTQTVVLDGAPVLVDTGFIVFNNVNYPHLVKFFEALGVPSQESTMSFGVSKYNGGFEYAGGDLKQLFAQPSNFFKPRYLAMLRDILRFNREAPALLHGNSLESLGEYLVEQKYAAGFVEDYILPMGAAIWSASVEGMKAFPARHFVRFFVNHGLLKLTGRPQWRTVTGGSQAYVARVMRDLHRTRFGTPVQRVERGANGVVVVTAAGEAAYDRVVFCTHADTALALLAEPTARERQILGAVTFQDNLMVLHQDARLMPKRKLAWSAWNYISQNAADHAENICLTYWMNALQALRTREPVLVSLNPRITIDPAKILLQKTYRHPQFNAAAMAAQAQLRDIQGSGTTTWFAGAWTGWGFHEDGISSAVRVAQSMGVEVPWKV
jgi:predicted NAD/FAD-binding protein